MENIGVWMKEGLEGPHFGQKFKNVYAQVSIRRLTGYRNIEQWKEKE
jgi:hypothetical protein